MGEALFRLGFHDDASEYLCNALSSLDGRYPRTRLGLHLGIMGQTLCQAWLRVRPRSDAGSGIPKGRFAEANGLFEELIRGYTATPNYQYLYAKFMAIARVARSRWAILSARLLASTRELD